MYSGKIKEKKERKEKKKERRNEREKEKDEREKEKRGRCGGGGKTGREEGRERISVLRFSTVPTMVGTGEICLINQFSFDSLILK